MDARGAVKADGPVGADEVGISGFRRIAAPDAIDAASGGLVSLPAADRYIGIWITGIPYLTFLAEIAPCRDEDSDLCGQQYRHGIAIDNVYAALLP